MYFFVLKFKILYSKIIINNKGDFFLFNKNNKDFYFEYVNNFDKLIRKRKK